MYGSFLRGIRESRGLTQHELAEVAGVSQPNISAIERGRRMPSLDTLNRIVTACGYELAAVAEDTAIYCPLPSVEGWFPDDDIPPALPDDPPDEPPVITRNTPMRERLKVIDAVLDAASARR